MKKDRPIIVLGKLLGVIFAATIGLSLVAGYLSAGPKGVAKETTANTAIGNGTDSAQVNPPMPTDEELPFFSKVFQDEASTPTASWDVRAMEIFVRLLLAVILSAILAFRPRRNAPLFQRNLYVAQTQILLSVVAAALMLIVGDNAARAFAIFAAVSLVRFRTNIRDPKEITVLLISLALGLAAGVGRWELGAVLCIFALVLLRLLEYNESAQVFRSMELNIKTRDTDRTHEILKKIFSRRGLEAEVRELDPQDEEKPVGSITYYLNLPLNLTTDELSDRILAADPENIERIQWEKTKSAGDIYQ